MPDLVFLAISQMDHLRFLRVRSPPVTTGVFRLPTLARINVRPREKTTRLHPSVRDRFYSSAVERHLLKSLLQSSVLPCTPELLSSFAAGPPATPRQNFTTPLPLPHAVQRFTLHASISCPYRRWSVSRADTIRHEQWGARWG
jgi:hypothetical protein